jgi:probable HAF family extracellular repeat protein
MESNHAKQVFFCWQLGRSDCLTSSCFRLLLLNGWTGGTHEIRDTEFHRRNNHHRCAGAPKLAGQAQEKSAEPIRYSVTALSTLGGMSGVGNGISNKGWVAGAATLSGDTIFHATVWQNGVITDLGTLGGPSSFVNYPVKNDRGMIMGFAETSTQDPLGEGFCAYPFLVGFNTGLACLGFVWQKGTITPLPPLSGGNNSQANGINNRGQVVGFAENGTPDATCILPQVLQIEAVIWGPDQDQIQNPQKLPPLPGDPDGAAVAINDKGQVAGCSGTCGNVCVHAVVWENGSPTELAGLGPFSNAAGINNRGQVGGSFPFDGTLHSFLWENGVPTDLGVLPGDVTGCPAPCPYGLTWFGGMNNKGQVVGHTCDVSDTYCSAYLWQNGVMTDLNTLIPPGSSLFLYYAGDINDRGEIVGVAIDQNNPANTPAFLAVPCDDAHASYEGCANGAASVPATAQAVTKPTKVVLPESIRQQLRKRSFGRFAGGPVTPQ